MKVLLISLPGSNTGDEPLFPLGIGYLVAMLKAEHEVKAIHYQRIEHVGPTFPDIIKSFRPDIIGLTCSTFNRGNVRKIIAVLKKYRPNVKVVVGGVHASYLYDQVLNNYGADVVVIAEGEYTALELCRAFESGTALDSVKGIAFKQDGRVVITPPREVIENIDELPMPDFDFAEQMMRNSGTGFIITSRGCTFCSTSSYWGQKVRKNSVERVVDKMEHLISKYGVRKIFFHDDTFNLGIGRVKRICTEIMNRKLRVQWGVSCRVVPVSQEMIDIMVAAGCRHICWGVESGSEQMLRRINKKITLEQIRNAYELCRKHHHIMSTGAFAIVGIPGETAETVKQTIDFFNSLPLTDHPSLGPFYLLPGTKIFNDLKAKGRIDDSCWLRTDDIIHYTDENSIQTLRNWSHAISQSGKILPFDKSKHFWNNILFGSIPQPKLPVFSATSDNIATVESTQTERPIAEVGKKKSELDDLIQPEIKNDSFYYVIQKLAREENIKTILEIGSSAGAGSTEAFVTGLQQNRNKPTLFCMEISKPRFKELQKCYSGVPNVKCYNLSSIPLEKFPTEQEVRSFYFNTKTVLNNFPVERVLGWLRQDIEYMKSTGLCSNGIQKIKKENNIKNFDMVLIDGSEFAGIAELNETYGAKFILLDDINGFKNYSNYKRLINDPNYQLVTEDWKLRSGFAVFERTDNILPIHFFTIVLNGQPYIRHHIEVFKQLPFQWHWHIVEGVAALKHDTAWSVQNGGYISDKLHTNGLSNDGTTEYLDELKSQFPDNVTIYRKVNGSFWDGKLEMVNAPLANINDQCLLWQVDSDELWTLSQIEQTRSLFVQNPHKTSAYFHCYYFVGPRKYVSSLNTWATYPNDWIRVWRFNSDMRWNAHEPPILVNTLGENVGLINPFTRDETKSKKITFQHFAYVNEAQVSFKEIYYGYKDAVAHWKRLQETFGPVRPADYLPWATDDAIVDDWKESDGILLSERLPNSQICQKNYSSISVDADTQFEIELRKLFRDIRPTKIIETGTYLGKGTTSIIWRALQDFGIDSDFTTIEVNPEHHRLANDYFRHSNIKVRSELGLSLPRHLLPSKHVIYEDFVKNKEFDNIYYDHDEAARSELYFSETNFDVPDDLLGKTLERYNFAPDFLLLDSAGHVGYLEFKYVLDSINKPCYIMLDDVYHCKHYKSLQMIKSDPRFEMIAESSEKFGFCLAKYSPDKSVSYKHPKNQVNSPKKVLIVRSDSMSNINEEKHCKILTGRQLICDSKTKIANAEKDQMLQAQTFLNEGHIMKALKGFENILALSQETVDAHLGRATCLARLGRLLEAEVEAQQVLSKDPKNLRLLQFTKQMHRLKPDLIGDRDIEWGYIKNRVEEMAKIQSRGLKLLDFGCGESAQLTRLTANMGYQVTAIDMVPLIVPLDSTHNIRFIQGDFLHQDWKIKSFDLIINCSSIEHSGLVGRYGVVEQGPDDDLEIVARMSRLIKPNGKMLLTIPVGLDKVVGSLHRVYGQTRLAKLLDGWEVQNSCFWVKDENNQWREVDEESALQREPMLAYGLGCFVLCPALRLTAPSDSTVPPIYDQKPIIFDRGEDKTAVNITVPEASISATSKLRPKVLIVKTDGIGDFVIFSGSLPYYRKLYPNAHIAITVRQYVAELAQACPYIDEVIVNHTQPMIDDQNYAAEFINRIRAAKFDVAICPIYSRDKVSDIIMMNSGASERIVSTGNDSNMSLEQISNNNPHFTKLVPARAGTLSEVERNKEFLEGLGVIIDLPYKTTVWMEQEHKDFAKGLLKKLNVERPIVAGPFAQFPQKNWTLQKWAKLISNHEDHPILICGTDRDTREAENLISLTNHGNIHNLCGKTTLRQLAAVLASSELYLGVDSGPAHIAATVNCPQVVIMGGGHFGRFLPYSPLTSTVSLPLDCYGCNWRCSYQQNHCVKDIVPEVVEEALLQTLAKTSGKPRIFLQGDSLWEPRQGQPFWKPVDGFLDVSNVEIATVERFESTKGQENNYLVTAIVSTYNSERFIRDCLEDLENQTIADRLEIIVVNSGSQQNEEAIVREFQSRYDNIKYIRTEERETIYKAWNRAIKVATGKYITNANTDDRHTEDALEKMAMALDQNPDKVLVFADQIRIKELNGQKATIGRTKKSKFLRDQLFEGQCPPGSQPTWRKSVHDVFGYFDEKFFVSGDYEFWFRVTQKFDFLHLTEILGERFVSPDIVGIANKDLLSWENEMVLDKCYRYALQEAITIGVTGISEHPIFSTWPEVNIWRQNTKAKLEDRRMSLVDNIKDSWDFRTSLSPKLTIVIVAYNRHKELLENLYALNEQNEKDFEVIVVDNGGDLSWLRQHIDEFKFGLCGIELEFNFGPSPARNIGTEFAKAEYIAFLDDDAVADKHLVRNIVEHFENYSICGLRGKVLPKTQTDLQSIPVNYDLGDQIITTACEVSCLSAFRKDVLVKMGGFDELLFGPEGMELSYRICKAQKEKVKSILYFPDVIVYHDHRPDGPAQTEKTLRQDWMELLAWRKDNDIRGYKELVHSLYPGNKAIFENNSNDYTWVISVAIYLQKNFPKEAIEWAKKAVALRSDGFKGCYILGSLYTWFGRHDKALALLERIYEPLWNLAISSDSEFVNSEFKDQVDIRDCYVSVCTQLAQCYMETNQYDRVKQVYTDLLNNTDMTIPPEQKAKIRVLLSKLQNVPRPVPKPKNHLDAPLSAFENEINDRISKANNGQQKTGNREALIKLQDTSTQLCTTDSHVPTNKATIGYDQIKDKIAEIEGLLSPHDEKFLFEVAKGLPDNSIIVEIGSYKGKSTCCLAYGCLGSNKKVYTIDIGFANEEGFSQWKKNIKAHNLQNYVVALPGDSREIVRKWDKKIDFIFIDGSHYYKTVLSDFVGFYPWVKENGIVAFHDVTTNCTGPMRVWQEKAKLKLYDTGICGGIAFGRKKVDSNKSYGQDGLNAKGTTVESIAKYHTHKPAFPKRRELEIVCSKSSDFEYKYKSKRTFEDKKQKILIVRPDSISDFVVFTTVLHCLKENYPNSHIAIFIQKHIAELAESCPYIDEVIPFDKKAAYSNRDYRRQIIEQLRYREFDIAIYPDSSRTIFGDLITLGSGAKEKFTFIGDDNIPHDQKLKNDRLYTKIVHLYEPEMLETCRHSFFIGQLGLDPGPEVMPNIWLTWEDVNYTDNLFKELHVENPIVICPFVNYAVLQWPIHKWADLISCYQDYPIIICGAQENKKQADELIALAEHKNIHNLCGRTTLRQLAVLLHRSRLCVSLESGPVHIACAVDCPNVVIAGGGQFGRYVPYSQIATVVYMPLDCYNCNWQCEHIEPLCITQIQVQMVRKAINEVLNGFSKEHLALLPQIEENEGDIIHKTTKSVADGTDSNYLVSAIVSTYNSEKFLRGCLEDLEHQTIADKLEIIVINSGSQENEEAIVCEYQQKYNNIVYIKTEQREGIYAAWNRAVKVAQGTFITNANTDDRYREDALEIMAETLLANPDAALVYGDQICTDTLNGTFANHHAIEMAKRAEYSHERLLFGCCVGSQPMWRKSLHNELGYFDDTLTCAGDWDFWLRISITSRYKFKHIPEFLGLYYYNENGIEHGRKIHSLYERYIVGKRYGNPYISVIPLYTSKDNPLVSVIMPAYNAAKHIAETIESVLIQNYRNFELIIVDDGSTDNTKDIVASFKDDKIKYFYKDNGGPSGSRNLAIKKAEGQYIMPLDADDMMTPDFISKHLAEFEKHPDADLVYCDVLLIDDNSTPIRIMNKPEYQDRRHLIRDLLRAGHPIVPFRLGIRRSVFDRIGFYDENLLIAEDYDMMRRFVKAGLKAQHLSEPLHLRRMHADSLSGNQSAQKAKFHFGVIKRFIDTFTYDELFPDVAWDEISPQMRQLHAKCLAAGTYLAIGQDYVKTNAIEYSRTAFDQACSELNDCVTMDPENQGLRQILQKSKLIRARYTEAPQQVVSK